MMANKETRVEWEPKKKKSKKVKKKEKKQRFRESIMPCRYVDYVSQTTALDESI